MSAPGEQVLGHAAAQLGASLRELGWRLATAESSTGGLIGHALTMNPGASDYYVGGVICYSDLAKEVGLGVPHALIAEHGAVSEAVAVALARGAAQRFETELGISVTGIAGPDGGSDAKPVGTHFIAAALRSRAPRVEQYRFGFDRDGNRAVAALRALEMALDEVVAASADG